LPDRTWQSYLYVLVSQWSAWTIANRTLMPSAQGGVAVLFSAVLAALLYCSCGWLKRKSATSSPLPYLAAVKVDPDDKNSPPSTSSSVSVQDHLIPGSACIPPSLWIPALQARPVSIALSELEPPRRTWIRDSSSTIGSSYGSGSGSPTTASPPLTPSSPTFASQFNGYAPAPLSSPALLAPPNSGWPSAEGTRARGSYAASRSDENLVSHGYAS
jgi:hypothetical protein